ncbi:MerR family transcriptional regulator [Aequorivita lipolytica]|uniref:MerR family transcriptional regulator n=1 Tax=Aequorivita lipolytica TaxID=153267 RepID=A0A5C6YM43_9FLAO|nr:MerR family transcriptional regulator [Aequorivita lipolytica]TXD68297.1 MerR family transcriptional regulator [Aequorivita lipolytica]SRX53433.1 HTH-type transcriptional repressor CarH [Aequorivita lipolytica]
MVKNQFGIKDLENLSNVKAHTIRIWEKRYNLLEPDRTDTNIRKYDLENLKKLLNIAYLYNSGHKISKLASLDSRQIQALIKESINELDSEYMLNIFKSAMFEFDGELFDTTIEKLLEKKSFGEIFAEVFVPLLNEMGILWHAGTIDPSHEHFVSEKIKHSIIQHSIKQKENASEKNDQVFALYLPYQEIHEIGLLYANYELISAGFTTIFLGANIPLDSLKYVLKTRTKVIFVTYFTVRPEKDNLETYVNEFQNEVSSKEPSELWVLGRKVGRKVGKKMKNTENIKFFKDLKEFTDQVKSLTNV